MAITGTLVGVSAVAAGANTDTTSNAPLTCTTNPNVGNQTENWNSSVTDDHDPAAVGDTITYTFVVPLKEAATPVTASYRGGQTFYNIPAGLKVNSVAMQNPAGGTQFQSTVAIQGSQIVVTSTANVPIDGTTYPTPNLVVNGTVLAAAAGPGINWTIPPKVVGNAYVNGIGTITATCTPNTPSTIIAKTTVPGASTGPTANSKTLTVSSGVATKITLSGTSPKGYALTYSIATKPAHGTLTGTAPAVTYTSTTGYTGADGFTFTVNDGHGGTATGTVTLKVVAGVVIDRTPPTITLTSPVHGAVYSPTAGITAAFSCADSTTSVARCTGTVANGAAVNLAVGVHTFTVQAVDAQGNKAQKLVSYRVINP
ncbi:MAG TPA: Ig-like domain-containing protein, partial [Acidimicrobiia bacterium]